MDWKQMMRSKLAFGFSCRRDESGRMEGHGVVKLPKRNPYELIGLRRPVRDEQNARVEVVDLFHFLVSLAQTLGMTAQDIYDGYVKKNEVNHKRQESGYAVKDHADSRHI